MTTRTINTALSSATASRTSWWLTRWLLPLLLSALALALYLPTLSGVHTFDALSYIRDVDERAGFFFHPHHLLYSPTGWLFWQGWRLFGYDGGSELALEVLNSIAGAACGFGLYRLVLRLTNHVWAALAAAALLMFNYGAWYFSVEVEVYLLALIWLLLSLALLIQLVSQPRWWTAPVLGFCVGMAALYHQTNGLLVPVVVAGVLLSPVTWRERIKQLVLSGALAGGIVALGYGLVGFGYNGYRSLEQLREWMFFFIETGWWGHATRDRLTDLGAGLGNSISTQGALPFWIGILVLLALGLPNAARRWPRIVALCLLWIAIFGGFFAWWEGENIEFWIGTLLPLWLLVGLAVAALRLPRVGPALQFAAVVLPLVLAWHNYPIVKRRGDPSQDLQRQIAAQVGQQSSAADLIIAPGGVMELYLPYYEQRAYVRTINMVLFETNGDIPAALGRLQYEIDTALHAGLAVLVGREAMELPKEIVQRYPIQQEQLDSLWAPYRAALQPAVTHDGTTYFWRIPSSTEVARGEGWRWQTSPLGWQATNVAAPSFDGAWCINPQSDPALISPRIDVDGSWANAVQVTMRTNAQNEQAQLFFADQNGAMSDERSVRWSLSGDNQSHTYTVPLTADIGWSGWITRLRLDPIAVGDSSEATRTCIESLKLVK
jgi:4-amino-4-deoxy-L-arabinose transferase-like glycosyltransferase